MASAMSALIDQEAVACALGLDRQAQRQGVPKIPMRIKVERAKGAAVALDRDDPACALRQQGAGKAPRAGPDLDDVNAFERASSARNSADEIEIEQIILPERSFCSQTVTPDHLAERRKVVNCGHCPSIVLRAQGQRSGLLDWRARSRRCQMRCRGLATCARTADPG